MIFNLNKKINKQFEWTDKMRKNTCPTKRVNFVIFAIVLMQRYNFYKVTLAVNEIHTF